MMAITGNESTDDLKLLLARRIYTAVVLNSSLLKVKDVSKIHDIENFINILKKRSAWNGIKPFLQHWPCFFSISEESNTHVIKPIVTIEFCRDFDGKKGCDKAYCSKLHVCRHFVKGKCTFGPRCKKPHHFENEGTREVLKKHFLDFLTNEQAREFLCRNVQHLLEPDNINTELPKSLEICKYYNVATGCTREICPYIHVCRFFAEEGNCKFGSQCIRKHDIENHHSRLLLLRYHMDHLSDAQVMAYLKIKGESRDQQQQQQQIQLNGQQISKNENPLINSPNVQMTIPQIFPSHFSLPTTSSNGFFGALHGNLTEEINRKLAQVTTQNLASIPIVHESNHTRKLSLPNPAINHTNILTAQISVEDIDFSHRSLSNQFNNKRNQEKANLSQSLQDTSNLLRQQHLSPPSSYPNNSCKSHGDDFLKVHPQDNRLGFVQNDVSSLNQVNDTSRANHVNPISRSLTDTLSMFLRNNESPQEYSRFRRESSENYKNVFNRHDVNHYIPHSNTSPALHHSLSNSNLPNNTHHFNLSEHHFSKSRSFENFKDENNLSLNNNKNLGNNGFSKTQPSFYKPFSTSLQTDFHNMFHSRSFLRSSSSDIISPTDSTSSVNGNTSGRKILLNGFNYNQQPHDHSLFFGSSDWTENDHKNKSNEDDVDDDLNFLSFRTRSLPNFNATNLERTRYFDSQLIEDCLCQKNQVCVFNLSGECKMASCLKLHTEETFQWQISSSTQTKTKNGSPTFFSNYLASNNYKKENFDKIKNEWINIEKNENIKLETAFSSCEIEQTNIEFYGVNVTVIFEDMVGIAGHDVLNSTTSVSGSADLSSWLMIQSNDDSSSRSNSQENVIYNVRRLSTNSAVADDSKYATSWLWYWQDSFGMWRNYPLTKYEVIEATTVLLNVDIEKAFLEDNEQHLFEEQQFLFDFKNMQQINTLSRKQRKIRRRPKFVRVEECDKRESMPSYNESKLPYYWKREKLHCEYQLVDVECNSEIYHFVQKNFQQSLTDVNHEMIRLNLVQNHQLWKQFSKLKHYLEDANVPTEEKFVFKTIGERELSGVCQQGFTMCDCTKNRTKKYFASTAKEALAFENIKDDTNSTGLTYMFCARMVIPLTDKKKQFRENGRSVSVEISELNINSDTLINCKHTSQVYPEFLIIFRT